MEVEIKRENSMLLFEWQEIERIFRLKIQKVIEE
jgi:hypothetical protein